MYHSVDTGKSYRTEFGACLGEFWAQGIKEPWKKGRYIESIVSVPLSIPLAALILIYPVSRDIALGGANVERISPDCEAIS